MLAFPGGQSGNVMSGQHCGNSAAGERRLNLEEQQTRRGARFSARLITEPNARDFMRSNASKSRRVFCGSLLAGERKRIQRHGGTFGR